jgi:hypothetical protein
MVVSIHRQHLAALPIVQRIDHQLQQLRQHGFPRARTSSNPNYAPTSCGTSCGNSCDNSCGDSCGNSGLAPFFHFLSCLAPPSFV